MDEFADAPLLTWVSLLMRTDLGRHIQVQIQYTVPDAEMRWEGKNWSLL